MATETVILRPNDSRADGTNRESYPSVDPTEYWTLVSEEVPDDDSTYVKPHLLLTSGVNYNFPGIPEQYKDKTPTKIKVYIRGCNKDTATTANLGVEIAIFDDSTSMGYNKKQIADSPITLSNVYKTYYIEIPEEYKLSFYAILTNENSEIKNDGEGEVTPIRTSGNVGNKDTSDVRVTQLYLELEYSNEEDEPTTSETIYLKQNGSWNAISGDIYKKENGTWILKDVSVLQQGLKYKINSV